MTAGELPMVRLVLHEADSGRLLRRALENAVDLHRTLVVQATTTAAREAARKLPGEARRHERRAAEYTRRQALLQQLLDQLPDDTAPLLAPMGDQ